MYSPFEIILVGMGERKGSATSAREHFATCSASSSPWSSSHSRPDSFHLSMRISFLPMKSLVSSQSSSPSKSCSFACAPPVLAAPVPGASRRQAQPENGHVDGVSSSPRQWDEQPMAEAPVAELLIRLIWLPDPTTFKPIE